MFDFHELVFSFRFSLQLNYYFDFFSDLYLHRNVTFFMTLMIFYFFNDDFLGLNEDLARLVKRITEIE